MGFISTDDAHVENALAVDISVFALNAGVNQLSRKVVDLYVQDDLVHQVTLTCLTKHKFRWKILTASIFGGRRSAHTVVSGLYFAVGGTTVTVEVIAVIAC